MGSPVSTVKAEAAAQSAENEKMANDSLNALMAMGAQKLETFELELSSATTLTFPINKIVYKYSEIKCGVTSDSTGLKEGVSKTIGHFANGDFLGGIVSAFETSVDAALGSYAGNQSEKKQYLVSVGRLGGFYRVDYTVYSYEFTSKALSDITKNVLCCALCISTIKTETLTPNDVRVILDSGFQSSSMEELKKMEEQIFQTLWPNGPPGPSTSLTATAEAAPQAEQLFVPSPLTLTVGSQDDEKVSAVLEDVKMFRVASHGPNVHLTPLPIDEHGLNQAMLNPEDAYLVSDPREGDVFVWVGDRAPENVSEQAARIGSAYMTNDMHRVGHVSVHVIHQNSGAQNPVFDRLFGQ